MQDSGRLSRHFWLTRGMARTVGVNLNAAVKDGRLPRSEFAVAIATCCACGRSHRCIGWMAQQTSVPESAPDFCALKPVLDSLSS